MDAGWSRIFCLAKSFRKKKERNYLQIKISFIKIKASKLLRNRMVEWNSEGGVVGEKAI